MDCKGVSGNWNITELGYKCLTEPCVYSRSLYTTKLSTCFHLISFSFGCERCASMEANKLASGAFSDLYPDPYAHFDFLLPSFGKISTSSICITSKVLITMQKAPTTETCFYFFIFNTHLSHTRTYMSVWKVSFGGGWEDKNLPSSCGCEELLIFSCMC